jgi:hypothetical protein
MAARTVPDLYLVGDDAERQEAAAERFLTSVMECHQAEQENATHRDGGGRGGVRRKVAIKLLQVAELGGLPATRWRIRGVLPAVGIGAIFGPSGAGKSFLALDLLGAAADGKPWFGFHVPSACHCVYVALEGEAGVAQRVRAYIARHGTPENLRVILSPLDIRRDDDRAELIEVINAAGMAGGILCLDTLNRAAPGLDENDSRDMGLLIEAVKRLQAELGGLVALVHHTGKDASKGLRGHSSLMAALDVAVEVIRTGDHREWKLAKSKDSDDDKAQPFRLDVVELGADADGWPVTSCTVEPETAAVDAVNQAKIPRGGNQRIAWNAIGELLRHSTAFGQAGAPAQRPCIRLDEAITQLRDRIPCDAKRKTERARQAITGLVASDLLALRDEWLWCT